MGTAMIMQENNSEKYSQDVCIFGPVQTWCKGMGTSLNIAFCFLRGQTSWAVFRFILWNFIHREVETWARILEAAWPSG